MRLSRKRPLDGCFPLIGRPLLVRAVRFAVDRLPSMDEVRTKIFSSGGTTGSAFGVVHGDLGEDDLAPYHDDDNGEDLEFADALASSDVDVRASLRLDFDKILELCCFGNFVVAEDVRSFFTVALQKLKAIKKQDYAVPAKAVTQE